MAVEDRQDGDCVPELNGPQIIASFTERPLRDERNEAIRSLPRPTRRRISALKKLQKDYAFEESRGDMDIHMMICRHHNELQRLNEKREAIIRGNLTPTDDDLAGEANDEEAEDNVPEDFEDNGIPDFWLNVLKCSGVTGDLVRPHDEPILSKLTDIRVVMNEEDPRGFTLEFRFSPNDYFNNDFLTKTYFMKFEPEPEDPVSYEGPYIHRSEGSTIDWKEGKNVTRKIVNKKQRHRTGNMTRIVTKEVKQESFFTYFSTVQRSDGASTSSTDSDEEEDFEIGTFFKDKLVPRAILYFSGEVEDDDMYEDDTDSDD